MPETALILLTLAGIVLITYFYKIVSAGMRRGAIANNVVAAYATFQTLDQNTKSRVVDRAEQIIRRSNWPKDKEVTFPTDVARWGWYALAMRELGIKPICLTTTWAIVSNPNTAMLATDTMLDTCSKIAEKSGHKINIDRSAGIFEEIASIQNNTKS